MLVDEIFMERFDRANHLADAGDYQQALEAYNNILAPSAGTGKKAITGEFLATVELRKAYCLSDLGRYQEALVVYQAMDTSDRAGQFDDDRLYEYYFSYGNLLGQLGQFDEMTPRLTQAVNIAANHAKADQVADSWRWLMHWGMVAEEWQWLLDTAEQARVFGMSSSNVSNPGLKTRGFSSEIS